MGRLTNQCLTERKGRHCQHGYKLSQVYECTWKCADTHTHSLSHFNSLSRCQNGSLGFCEKRHISIRLNRPSGTRWCFQPSTTDWIIQSDVNQRQAKSDKEVDLINPMVLLLTCLISHQAYQVVYHLVPVIQPLNLQWQTLRKANPRSAGVRVEAMRACQLTYRTPFMARRTSSREMLNGHSNWPPSLKAPPPRQISKKANAFYKLHFTRLSVHIKQAVMR